MADFDEFEARLRQFRPRRPAAIPDERLQRLRGPIWVAVAATLAAAMLIASWLKTSTSPRPADLTLGALTKVTVESPEDLDATLTRLSRTSLPDVMQPGGALEQLAKEF
jgi:hypothetical protein